MPFQFAIIGCGRIADRHAENIIKTAKLSAVCDIVKERADNLANKYNANPYYSLEQLLQNEKQVHIASICTPNGLHASQSIKCLESGLHVLCEKPLCISTKDGSAMLSAAKHSKKNLYVVKQNRFNPPVIKLKKILNKRRLGEIYSFQINCFWNRPEEYYKQWRGTKALDGGTLFTQFSHFIDLLYWMLGDVKKITGFIKNYAHPKIEFEDTGIVSLEMVNGAIGTLNYNVNSFKQNMEGSFTIFGKKGTIKIGGQYLNELEYQAIDDYKIKNLSKGNPATNYGYYKGSMSNHDKVYEHLFKALKNEKHEMINPEDALKTVEIIERIYKECK